MDRRLKVRWASWLAGLVLASMIVQPAQAAPVGFPQFVNGGNSSIWHVRNDGGTSGDDISSVRRCDSTKPGFTVYDGSLNATSTVERAFDTGATLWVKGSGPTDPFVQFNATATTGTVDLVGRTITTGIQTLSGLTTRMQYYVATNTATLRTLATFENPSTSTVTVTVSFQSNSGAEDQAQIPTTMAGVVTGTSSGDSNLTTADRWALQGHTVETTTAMVTHVLYGPNSPSVTPSAASTLVSFACPAPVPPLPGSGSKDGIRADYILGVPGPGVRSLMWFNQLHITAAEASTAAVSTFDNNGSLGADILSGLTPTDLFRVANWKFAFTRFIATSSGAGERSLVSVWALDPVTGLQSQFIPPFEAYPGFFGGVRVAMGDLDGDGKPELITAAGPGGGPHVRVFDFFPASATVTPRSGGGFFAFDSSFRGGVNVAVGDIDGDGTGEIITGQGPGGTSRLRAFHIDPTTGTRSTYFDEDAYEEFTGGMTVATGELHGNNGGVEIVTGAMGGGGPRVRIFQFDFVGALVQLPSFFAYDKNFSGGVDVAVGDVDGDGTKDLITGAGPGGGPHVKVFK
ncbi:MAG TPA: VCBS repeat-containing protein, partial [Actinomycetota bacterium]|nr:VCBS repeat-containing protein [Actinomycetota bacterium]